MEPSGPTTKEEKSTIMSAVRKSQYRKYRQEIVQNLSSLQDVLCILQQRGILTEREVSQIMSKGVTFRQIEELLDVLSRKENKTFDVFIDVLKQTNNRHLAHLLEKEETTEMEDQKHPQGMEQWQMGKLMAPTDFFSRQQTSRKHASPASQPDQQHPQGMEQWQMEKLMAPEECFSPQQTSGKHASPASQPETFATVMKPYLGILFLFIAGCFLLNQWYSASREMESQQKKCDDARRHLEEDIKQLENDKKSNDIRLGDKIENLNSEKLFWALDKNRFEDKVEKLINIVKQYRNGKQTCENKRKRLVEQQESLEQQQQVCLALKMSLEAKYKQLEGKWQQLYTEMEVLKVKNEILREHADAQMNNYGELESTSWYKNVFIAVLMFVAICLLVGLVSK